ncbi:class I SAM-dependent methyltransferase [Nitratireductor sp. StC3]|uniref:class I SAM-dependent methyltransferase n=1 Tax=Nitratireductor sp. StC3 TaxID=2126741 RepID=UPI000D0E142E|nr:class I SAM-dependent methyltransferase [Nitratireductor sp. StC3]PSM17758.1 SAM-dependent methyltransferase [Nitratireductor sp. StC3]
MTAGAHGGDHAALMDANYRFQRHVYDLTRKYYLLGRDRLVDALQVPAGGSVLELGCGTGRNLVQVARRYPHARLFGLDISHAMLATAHKTLARRGLGGRARLARADATDFDAETLFGHQKFERVFVSYALSMIPGWERTVAAGLACLAPGGSLHIVDFGGQERLPRWFGSMLRAWLARFHVAPRDGLREVLESESQRFGASLRFDSLFRGYAVHAVVTRPSGAARHSNATGNQRIEAIPYRF